MEERVLKLPPSIVSTVFTLIRTYISPLPIDEVFGKLKHTQSLPKITNPKDIALYPIMTGLLGIIVMFSLT
jgi:hypothetical protein